MMNMFRMIELLAIVWLTTFSRVISSTMNETLSEPLAKEDGDFIIAGIFEIGTLLVRFTRELNETLYLKDYPFCYQRLASKNLKSLNERSKSFVRAQTSFFMNFSVVLKT